MYYFSVFSVYNSALKVAHGQLVVAHHVQRSSFFGLKYPSYILLYPLAPSERNEAIGIHWVKL